MKNITWIIVIGVLLVLCCCCSLGIVMVGGTLFAGYEMFDGFSDFDIETPVVSEPTRTPVVMVDDPDTSLHQQNLNNLLSVDVPVSDPRLLAYQYGLAPNMDATVSGPPKKYQTGDQETFWAFNNDTNQPYQVTARLGCERDDLYFWIGTNVKYRESDLQQLCDAFQEKIYPTNVEFFGSEWKPGVDNDPHVYILFAKGMGSVGGYFSSHDQYLPQVHPYSNAHEIIFISADYNTLDREYTYGVIAHELQHMIHYNQDMNEDGWINEGMSELAALLNDYDPGGMDADFLRNTDWQLNTWPTESELTYASYGSAFLFTAYFLDRFGEDATKRLVSSSENGFNGLNTIFNELNITQDDQTIYTAEDFFVDWTIANAINNHDFESGKYAYHLYSNANTASVTEKVRYCDGNEEMRTVSQFGTDYIDVGCSSDFTFNFQGSAVVDLLPEKAHSGEYAFWSNRGDDSMMTLRREFDLTKAEGPVKMSYWTWFDLEQDYDFLYVEASLDGEHWDFLKPELGTSDNISGNNYGYGYTGKSGGWVQEAVDLSSYAGKKVTVRFSYITDPAVNGEGLLVDDISVSQINYQADFEEDDGGWVSEGFVKVSQYLPQTYRVSIIKENDGNIEVEKYAVDLGEKLSVPVRGSELDSVLVVISGTTPITRTPASYFYQLTTK